MKKILLIILGITFYTFCFSQNSSNLNEQEQKNERKSTSVQCKGTTKAGIQCKNKTYNSGGYCNLHLSQQPSQTGNIINTVTDTSSTQNSENPKIQPNSTNKQCSGMTKAGKRCSRMTKSQNGKCYQHGGN